MLNIRSNDAGLGSLPIHFDLIDIRLFINIAEKRSLSQGAEHSYMSPPAASIRIRNIEEKLGARLLHRTSHGVSLTPAGDAFLKHGRLVLQQLEHLHSDLRDCVSNPRQHLRICADRTAITEFLPEVLSAYLAGGRNVNVELQEQSGSEIVRAITEGSADIGIVEGNVQVEGLEAVPYRSERLVLVTSAEHPLRQKKEVAFAETVQFDYIALPGGVPVPDPVTRAGLNVRACVANFEVMCRLVASDIGIAILPETAARRNAGFNPIRMVRLKNEWAENVLRVCMRSLDSLPSFAQKLVALLIADAKRLTN